MSSIIFSQKDDSNIYISKGFWNKKNIIANLSDKLYLLKQDITTDELVNVMADHRKMFLSEKILANTSPTKLKNATQFPLRFTDMAEFSDYLEVNSNGVLQGKTIQNFINSQPSTNPEQQLLSSGKIITDTLLNHFSESPHKVLNWDSENFFRFLCSLDLLFNAEYLKTLVRDDLFSILFRLSQTDWSTFNPTNQPLTALVKDKKNFLVSVNNFKEMGLYDDAITISPEFAIWIKPILRKIKRGISTENQRRNLLCAYNKLTLASGQWLALGALKKYWIMPPSNRLVEILTSLQDNITLPLSELSTPEDKINHKHYPMTVYKKQQAFFICCTTIREIEDLPQNVANWISFKNTRQWWGNILNDYQAKNNLPLWPIDLLNQQRLKTVSNRKKWTVSWAKENMSPAWADFVETMYLADVNLNCSTASSKIRNLYYWAKSQNITSPWEITPNDLLNASIDKNKVSFREYLQKIRDNADKKNSNSDSHVKRKNSSTVHITSWQGANSAFELVVSYGKLPGTPVNVLAHKLKNPFEGFEIPFRTKRRSSKTPRARMLYEIQEALVDELLGLEKQEKIIKQTRQDQNGNVLCNSDGSALYEEKRIIVEVPTFKFAKKIALETIQLSKRGHPDFFYVTNPQDPNKKESMWNPSTAVILALLLLLPIRSIQARWLDQGLMDDMVFDRELRVMVKNTHSLQNWTYSNGISHSELYGSRSGILQTSLSDFQDVEETILWISTNKTALWDGAQKTGYSLPWPDGLDLLNSENNDVQAQGRKLARVYEVLNYQFEFMEQYDPEPIPISFQHSTDESYRVPHDEDELKTMPWFVPLCRDLGNPISITLPNGETSFAAPCIPRSRIVKLYSALCFHVEQKLKKNKQLSGIKLTGKIDYKHASHAYKGYVPLFDIHSLRVAGISHLIELGVPIYIVSEYIAGHSTIIMTLHYFKTHPLFLRKKLMDAMLNGQLLDGYESIVDELSHMANSQNKSMRLHESSGLTEHSIDLSVDFAALSPVEGGVCLVGGRGSRCYECGIEYRNSDTQDRATVHYVQKLAGCAGGRFYRTGPDFSLMQTLEANRLMLMLRRYGRERDRSSKHIKELSISIKNTKLQLEDPHLKNTNQTYRSLQNLESKHRQARLRLQELDQETAPYIASWVQRFFDLKDSAILAKKIKTSEQGDIPILLVGEPTIDYNTTSDIGNDLYLARTILEQTLFLKSQGVSTCEVSRLFVDQFMNTIMSTEATELMLPYNSVIGEENKAWVAAVCSSVLAQKFGDDAVQSAGQGNKKLGLLNEENRPLLERLLSYTKQASKASENGLSLAPWDMSDDPLHISDLETVKIEPQENNA